MGPPTPENSPKEGRYNRTGTAVLYLSTTIDGVRRELRDPREPRLCIQEYVVDNVRIADLSSPGLPMRLQAAFELAESAGVEGRGEPATFALAHHLADSIFSCHYDGFLVPGVRGDASSRYSNLVIFLPDLHWERWSRRHTGFHRDP